MNKKAIMSVVLFLFLAVSCSPERQVIQSLQPTPTLVPTLPPTLTLTPTSIGISTSTVLPTQSVSIPKGALLLYTSGQSIQVIPAIGGVPISVVENNTLH